MGEAYRNGMGLHGTELRRKEHGVALGLLCVVGMACGCGDSSAADISERDATSDECVAGGTVLLVDGKTAATVCNGSNGRDGAPGIQGSPGAPGTDGVNGARGPTGMTGKDAIRTSDIVEGIARRAPAIVIVECTDGVTSADGSGTKTSTGTVITALHVVNDLTTCNVYSESPVTLLGTSTSHVQRAGRDAAELTVTWTSEGSAIAGLAPQLGVVPAIGELVTVVGNPGLYDGLALEHQYTTGFVTATHLQETFSAVPSFAGRETLWAQAWSTDAVTWHGNSGGPVFNADGAWIGILVGGFNGDAQNEGPDLSVVLPLF